MSKPMNRDELIEAYDVDGVWNYLNLLKIHGITDTPRSDDHPFTRGELPRGYKCHSIG